MQHAGEFSLRPSCPPDVVTVGLVDHDGIGHFHDPPFDPLQFVTRPGQQDQQEEIHHSVYGGFGLPHSDGLHENGIETRRLAKYDRLPGFSCHTTQGAARWRRPYIGFRHA